MARILLLHLADSGHHAAARAIDAALKALHPGVQTHLVDPLELAHPYFSALIHKTYMALIRGTPELWDAMYDSVRLARLNRRVQWLRRRGQSAAMRNLLGWFRPNAVVCTQAYSFGVMSAYQERYGATFPLFGVVTDYRPHRFWVQDGTGRYLVPDEEAAQRLVALGVAPGRILVCGIPIHPAFATVRPADPPVETVPRILVMGGSQGLGVRFATVRKLDRATARFAVDVVTGHNRRLYRRLERTRLRFHHPLHVRGYVPHVADLMSRSRLLISKPGGLTCAEAMATGLPMLVVRPLPGQESGNLEKLVRHGAALHLQADHEIPEAVDSLLAHPERLASMRRSALRLGRPTAAFDIARAVLTAIEKGAGA